jgi:hypothetical protein
MEASVATLIVETPQNDSTFSVGEPRDAFEHEVGKPTPLVAMPFVATTPKYAIFSAGASRGALDTQLEINAKRHYDAMRHDSGKPTLSVTEHREDR